MASEHNTHVLPNVHIARTVLAGSSHDFVFEEPPIRGQGQR
jgi:hypothetical protein